MRHWLGSVVTWAIATLLITGAAAFAWVRAAQIAITDERTAIARFEPAPAHEFDWRELGRSSYVRNCSNCHRLNGQGWDQYPPLAAVAAQTLVAGGREHLLDLHIHGLDSDRRIPMPPMGHIPPAELAAVINHVLTSFGNEQVEGVQLYSPDEVRARLGQRLSPRDVYERRQAGAPSR
jgi:mono/diheme cytochrome c family protein